MLQPRLPHRRPLILLSTLFNLLSAQDTLTPPPADTAIITPASASGLPTTSDNAGYAPNNPQTTTAAIASGGHDGRNGGLLNYYFLLLAVFIVVIVAIYWSLSRKRKASLARQQSTQQDALAMDLSRSGWRTVPGRWRRHYVSSRDVTLREEEGLNERGEAPPPYLKEPEEVHLNGRERDEDVELRSWNGRGMREGKPPGYEERPTASGASGPDSDVRRPS
ncbi:MAG: hypothetical protein Q9217_002464 [Psora testacea]